MLLRIRGTVTDESESDCHELIACWISRLQRAVEERCHRLHFERRRIDTSRMIELVLLSDLLRDSGDLKRAMLESCRLLLSEAEYSEMHQSVTRRCQPLPSKAKISRARLQIDTALMVLYRVTNWLHFRQRKQLMRDFT